MHRAPHRPTCRPIVARRAAALALVVALAAGACSGEDDGGSGSDSTSTREVDVAAVLGGMADDVLVPGYTALGTGLDALASATTALCGAPSAAGLDSARDAWRDALRSWQYTRAAGVGPALEQRLMSNVGFAARARVIALLLAGDDPVDPTALTEEGAAARGLYAEEEALFGEGSEALASHDGARRCQYAQSVATLAAGAAEPVVAAWAGGEARGRFVAGLDGGPHSTVTAVVNELSHRLEEIDGMSLRDMASADGPDDLDAARLGGPGDYRIAERVALLDGITDAIGDGTTGISAVVAGKDADTAERLVAAGEAATTTMAALPDSVTAAFDDPDAIAAAADAVAELKVLLSTEAASLLGVTINFSDSDGDS